MFIKALNLDPEHFACCLKDVNKGTIFIECKYFACCLKDVVKGTIFHSV